MPDKERKEVGPTELTVGPRPATMDQIVDAILGNEDELISNISEFPDSIVVGKSTPMSHPPTDLEVKTLCLLARVAISRGDRDTILTACHQATCCDSEAGALITMLAPRAGAVDIEHTGLCELKASHPELLEWTIEEAIKLGPACMLARRAFFWLISVNSERAKELAPTILSDPNCSPALASTCELAMSFDPPMRFEVSTPTLTPAQQANVKRIFPIACRAIFSVDMDEATESIRQLGAEPVQLAAPLLVAAARMEGDRPQAAAREELRKIAPSVAAVLPAQFGFFLPRGEQ